MDERSAAVRKVYEYELLAAESSVKFYRGLLGMPPVGSSANCAEEIKNLKNLLQEKTKELDNLQRCLAQQKNENEILHRKVNDLGHKFSQARRERNKFRNELKETRKEFSAYLNKNIKKGLWSGDGKPQEGELVFKSVAGTVRIIPSSKNEHFVAKLKSELDKVRAKAALYDELLEDASDCLVGSVIGIKHEPNDLEPDGIFYFLRITKDEAYRIDMGGYAHLEVWED